MKFQDGDYKGSFHSLINLDTGKKVKGIQFRGRIVDGEFQSFKLVKVDPIYKFKVHKKDHGASLCGSRVWRGEDCALIEDDIDKVTCKGHPCCTKT
jgi:hypothetical protein